MTKLKNIVKQLSEKDYETIYTSLINNSADKSAFLLKTIREKQVADRKIMKELSVNTNAYYTLRSRLNLKIEEYLLQQMESPRTDILKKVANINELIFTKKNAIAVATLKKLEKELLDYDLSNELTIVYKFLKKLHRNSPEYFNYSQLYNKHVAYMLAVDKAEDLLSKYFLKYGDFFLSGDETDRLELDLLGREINNIASLYQSHRLYVYKCCLGIFHRLFVEEESESMDEESEPIEDMLHKVENIFNTYKQDSIYYHLNLVFEFLKLEYYNHYKVYRKAEKYFEEINEATSNLLTNYGLYTFPAQFLITKLKRGLRMGIEYEFYEENEALFQDYEVDKNNVPEYVIYMAYRALSCYYVGKYEEASRYLNNLLNEVSLKKYLYVQLEIKALLALQYCLMDEYDLFKQLINSVTRQTRYAGSENCRHIQILAKILKISASESKRNKEEKIGKLVEKITVEKKSYFAPTFLIKMDDSFVNDLASFKTLTKG